MHGMCKVNLALVSLIGAVPGSRNYEQVAKAVTDHERVTTPAVRPLDCFTEGDSIMHVPCGLYLQCFKTFRTIPFFSPPKCA